MTYVGELKSFVDSQRSVYVKEADNSITPFEITKYETNLLWKILKVEQYIVSCH